MRVAMTGTTGRLGAALARHFAANHEVIPLPRQACELASPVSLANALEQLECEVFLNPAAITSLEICEEDPAAALRVNAQAPAEISAWAADRGVKLVHFSTDYVFNGKIPGLRDEDEIPDPLSVYGRTKLAGEAAVLKNPGNCVIRISWVFGPDKPSFLDAIYDAALAGRPVAAVADKFSLPTFTTDLAERTERLIESKVTGIIHACHSGEPISWHGMAEVVLDEMVARGLLDQRPAIQKLKLDEMASFRAKRPRFTAMSTARLTKILGQPPRPWPEAVADYVRLRSLG